tara:strand:- start:682 stop:996 length:315 start_codon:yes stop_codon:yes gene_type:complete
MIEYILVGVLAPISLNLIHLLVGIYIVVKLDSILSLGFTGISFVTKSMAMIFLLWLGIVELELNYKIFVPLLTFFWFMTHVIEAFVIQHYIRENESDAIRSVQR